MFRRYNGQDGDPVLFKSTARKCSLPVRVSSPDTDILPEDGQPQEVSDEKVEEFALRAFFHDYCIVSYNQSLSRGYLDGLELMLHHLGRQSDLAKACKVVALANHGIKLHRPGLTRKAETLYHDLLGSMLKSIENTAFANTAEALMIAMLLGLYEVLLSPDRSMVESVINASQMSVADETRPSSHNAHARGVAAILRIEKLPLDLFGAVRSTRSDCPVISSGVVQVGSLMSILDYLKVSILSLLEMWQVSHPMFKQRISKFRHFITRVWSNLEESQRFVGEPIHWIRRPASRQERRNKSRSSLRQMARGTGR